MSKRFTVNVPDHVAAVLDEQPNVSAFVTRAVESASSRELVTQMLAARGVDATAIPDERRVAIRRRLAGAAWSDESLAWVRSVVGDEDVV